MVKVYSFTLASKAYAAVGNAGDHSIAVLKRIDVPNGRIDWWILQLCSNSMAKL